MLADYLVRGHQSRPVLPSNGHHYHHFWNYSGALLAHAQLSIFAQQSGLEELHDISLYKLLYMLHDFPFHKKRVGDILQLVGFVFESEPQVCQNLRALTLDYVTLHIKQLFHDEEFQLLLQETPSLDTLVLKNLCDLL